MPMRIKTALTLLLICSYVRLPAQELNIGFHIDPIFNLPLVSNKSVRNGEVSVALFRPGYNAGLNLNYRRENIGVELAANFIRRSVTVFNSRGHYSGQEVYYRTRMPSSSFEFPLTVNFLLDRHDNKTKYDLYLVAGVGYELVRNDSSTSNAAATRGGVKVELEGKYKGPLFQGSVVPQIGFKINAILKNVGLIDYGVSFHLPLSVSGPYNVDATITGNQGTIVQNSSIYATTSFLDVKLCYYFLSIGKKMKRVRYRVV
jgi:hypothetical protein